MVKEHYSTEDLHSLIKRFEAQQLPKAEWTHEAHLAVAIWYLSNYNFDEALKLMRTNITNHNASVGTPNTDDEGYHETITRFWLIVTEQFLLDKNKTDVTSNLNKFIASQQGLSSYPFVYYNSDTLFSVEARRQWVEPDLKPFY